MYCKNCGNMAPDGAKFCGKCGAIIDSNTNMASAISDKRKKRIAVLAGATGAIALISVFLIVGMMSIGSRRGTEKIPEQEELPDEDERATDENENVIVTDRNIADASPIKIETLESVDLSRRDHTPGEKVRGMEWDKTLFYWLEDTDSLSDENDNYISKCHVIHYQMYREDTGRNIEYEVYADPESETVHKIVSIEQIEDGQYELVDYYYADEKPNFIFQRYDSVYTPTYATLKKPGMRYYFMEDTLVRHRYVDEELKVSQTGLLVQDRKDYEEFDYFTAPDAVREQYEQLETEWLNKAYNTYDAVKEGASIGVVSGTLRDTAGNALSGYRVYVQNTEDGSILYQAETDETGAFSIYVYLDGKDCRLYVAGDDTFEDAYVYGVSLKDTSLYYNYDSLTLHRFDGDSYPVMLQLCNAEELDTGAEVFAGGVIGADIVIRKGRDARQGASVWEGVSDDTGAVKIPLLSGSYTAEISGNGYATNYINLEVTDASLSKSIYMIKPPEEGQTAILMTWSSELGKDLDLTVFTPHQGENGDMAHIGGALLSDEYGNYILHDNGMGCEAAYIDTAKAGAYKIYVNDYTDSIEGAYDTCIYSKLDVHIYIYQPDGFVTELNVPGSDNGVIWEAAEITGNRISVAGRIYTQPAGKDWWTANKSTTSTEKLIEQFLNNEVPAIQIVDDKYYNYYLKDFEWMPFDEEPSAHGPFGLDLDNDGQDELVWNGAMYGSLVIDVRDGRLYVLAEGDGTGAMCSYTFVDGEAWIVYSDILHMGRETYYLEKFNGNGEAVDEFDLSAEYWEEPEDRYNENSDFTYRGEKITMQEFENLRKHYLGY